MTTNAIETQGTTLHISGDDNSESDATITAIALGNPTVLTSAAHGFGNGDIVTAASFAGDDATSINSNEYVVMYVTTDTFAIDLDSSALTITDNSDAATMTPKDWTAVGEVIDFDGPGGSASVIDATHLTSTAREKLMGIPDEGQFSFSLNRVFSDTGQEACLAARAARTERNFKVTYTDDTVQTFAGYVLQFSTTGGVDDKVNGSITVEITGSVTTT